MTPTEGAFMAELRAANEREDALRGRCLVLDHQRGWVLPAEQRAAATNVLARTRALYAGMHAIARRVQSAEAVVREQNTGQVAASWGMLSGIDSEATLALLCDFDAFAVHLSSYVRVVSTLAKRAGLVSESKSYRADVLGPVEWYRNKVAAHPAEVAPHGSDQPLDPFMSVFTRIALSDDRIRVGTESIQTPVASHDSTRSEWSLSEMWSALTTRYWPPFSDTGSTFSISDLPARIGMVMPLGRTVFMRGTARLLPKQGD